jgi:prolyl 4-hydroxylase
MTATTSPAPLADADALRRFGETVRARLNANPRAKRLPVKDLEAYGVGGFLTATECSRLIAIIDEVAEPSTLFDPGYSEFRTSYSGNVDPWDPFILGIEAKLDSLLGLPHENGETIQGQRYQVGQKFSPHHDFFYTDQPYWAAQEERGGQRSWTAMAYLNRVEEGGTTDFPNVALSVPPQAGALLIWNNMRPDGSPNPATLHTGTPVKRGTKYVITKWYRARRWR